MPPISSFARKGAIHLLVLVAILFPWSLKAAPEPIPKLTVEQVATLLGAEGYDVVLDPDGDADWSIDGKRTKVSCQTDGTRLNFYVSDVGEKIPLEKINEWNRTKSYSRSYIDRGGSPALELDLDLTGGVTRAQAVRFFVICKASLTLWKQTVIGRK